MACIIFIILVSFQVRSEVIATYALCGFSNLGSLGVMLGGMIPLVPHRKSEISETCIRALFAATIACLMTASVAGGCLCHGRVVGVWNYKTEDFDLMFPNTRGVAFICFPCYLDVADSFVRAGQRLKLMGHYYFM